MNCRKFEMQDVRQVAPLYLAHRRAMVHNTCLTMWQCVNFLEQLAESSDGVSFVCEDDGKIVGLLLGIYCVDNGALVIRMFDIFVLEGYRRNGLGSILIGAMEVDAKSIGTQAVMVDPLAGEDYEAFFETMQYHPHAVAFRIKYLSKKFPK